MPADIYKLILERADELIVICNATKRVDAGAAGDITLDPTLVLMHQAKFMHDEIETEVNITSPGARPPYHWLVEITVRSSPRKHYLLTDEDTIVEAYGKHITPVSAKNAQALLGHLEQLGN